MDLTRLGAVLRERREALGIPRAELARRVGVTPTYIWLIEGARPRRGGEPSRPGQALLERWATVLGMDERYTRQILLLGGYGASDPPGESSEVPVHPVRTTAPTAPMRRPIPAPTLMHVQAAFPSQQAREADLLREAPVNFPQPRDLETEVLLESVRDLLRLAAHSPRDWEETVRLLQSFLDWLRYRLESR